MILTSTKNVHTKGVIVMDAWAKNCDNFKLVALLPSNRTSNSSTTDEPKNNISNTTLNHLNNNHKKYEIKLDESDYLLQPPGLVNDTYDRLTDKVFLTYKYLYTNYGDYDWYLKADDDTFVFMENLRRFLADKDSSKPVTFGYVITFWYKNIIS